MDKMLFVAYDGDGCGKKVGRAIIANDEEALHEISAKIDLGHEIANHWVAERGGKQISGGGDEGAFKLPAEAIEELEELRKDYHYATGITISVGVGKTLSEAGRSLLAAKFRGKDQIAHYGEDVEKDIQNARKKVKKGKASQEEYKLAEAYLEKAYNMADRPETKKKSEDKNAEKEDVSKEIPESEGSEETDCQYCNETDGVDPDHCKYCHGSETGDGEEDCKYCQEVEEHEGTEEDCPYCNQASESPDSNNEEASADSDEEKEQANSMGMNPPIQDKPEIGDNSSPAGVGEANPSDAGAALATPQADEGQESNIPEEGAHSKESLQAIAAQIEAEGEEGEQDEDDESLANQIDDTDLAISTDTEENTSRPNGYNSNSPNDMGLSEDDASENGPDLSDVLQEGLDSHADSIQREKVVQMASQALEGFKSCRDVIEKAKEQAPQLYQSSILMLKAMIEMAKMLGLGEEVGGKDVQEPSSEEPSEDNDNEWNDPFPTHPDHGGQAKPGHSAPQENTSSGNGAIGQPIGKLSAKHTTKHVARTPMPPGAVNAKGQQKVIDPKTGKVRWIDRKNGMVQSATGIPIKPPKTGGNDGPQA